MAFGIGFSRRLGLVLTLGCIPQSPLVSSDCNGNGVADSQDLSQGTSADCNGNSWPDECDIRAVNVSLARRLNSELTREGEWLASADMNGDGWPDIAAVDRSSLVVRVLVNQQVNPPFSDLSARQYSVGDEPRGAVVHDLDADGDLDLAVTQKYIGQVTVLLNDGGGALSTSAKLPTGGWAVAIAAADLDGDGKADLAVVNSGKPDLVVYPGIGLGAYGARRLVRLTDAPSGEYADGIAVGDVDRDGDNDIVVASEPRSTYLEGSGSGSFASTSLPLRATSVHLVDLDSDGDLDLVTAMNDPAVPDEIHVSLVDARAGFAAPVTRHMDAEPGSLAPVDLDLDGSIDFVTANGQDDSLGVIINLGDGQLASARRIPFDDGPGYMAPGDFDRDGIPDLAVGMTIGGFGRIVLAERTLVVLSEDRDRNGVPEECELAVDPGDDCNRNGIRDTREQDCNSNGILDECDIGFGTSFDCNLNGLPDECEPADRLNVDYNHDGKVSICEGAVAYFAFGFRDEIRVVQKPEAVEAELVGQLHSTLADPNAEGVQAWALAIATWGCELSSGTTDGTAADDMAKGGFLDGGFRKTELVQDLRRPGEKILISAVVLSFVKPVTLDPGSSPHDVVRFALLAPARQDGACAPCLVKYIDTSFGEAVVLNYVTVAGSTVRALPGWKAFELCPAQFRRGDANADGRVDISDAIRTFMFLFLGASEPKCFDAADANDDARVDLSDGVAILSDFFVPEDTRLPSPGPFACGVDPTKDALACALYDFCEPASTP